GARPSVRRPLRRGVRAPAASRELGVQAPQPGLRRRRRHQPPLRPPRDRLAVHTTISESQPRRLIADRFELDHVAGTGGLGIVYRANDILLGVPVALKMPRDQEELMHWRLLEEGLILSQVQHPHVVRYVAHGRTVNSAYVAMEWLDGETLATRLEREPLTVAETIAFIETVAAALGALHERGLVHPDIKPGNLFLV